MKNRIMYLVIPVMVLIVANLCDAQTLQQNTAVVSSGAAIVNGSGDSGNVTIGTVWLSSSMFPLAVASTPEPIPLSQVFPNPSTGEFTIILPDGAGEINRIDLLDEAGHVVADLTHSVTNDADGIHIKTSAISMGTYFVRVEARTGEYLYKIVIHPNGK